MSEPLNERRFNECDNEKVLKLMWFNNAYRWNGEIFKWIYHSGRRRRAAMQIRACALLCAWMGFRVTSVCIHRILTLPGLVGDVRNVGALDEILFNKFEITYPSLLPPPLLHASFPFTPPWKTHFNRMCSNVSHACWFSHEQVLYASHSAATRSLAHAIILYREKSATSGNVWRNWDPAGRVPLATVATIARETWTQQIHTMKTERWSACNGANGNAQHSYILRNN